MPTPQCRSETAPRSSLGQQQTPVRPHSSIHREPHGASRLASRDRLDDGAHNLPGGAKRTPLA